VAGSTLEDEEESLLDTWPSILEAHPQLAMVLAPRHPERFGAVVKLLEESVFPSSRRSKWRSMPPQPLVPGEIVLLDTIGELASVYSLAAAAFVGGSLVLAGGHNPLEPAQFGVPIVMGPNYANFRAITVDLLNHSAIHIAGKEELAAALIELLRDTVAASAMGERARKVFDQQAGATQRCVTAIKELLAERGRTK
jgi:3-deoxy-D-manno-octulosonic-acid transferase